MISRQYIWQLRKKAQGLCTICGKGKLLTGDRCKVCAKKHERYKSIPENKERARKYGREYWRMKRGRA